MGIVLKQSLLNTIVLFLGFAIGGINVLFLYTSFLDEDYYGLITFLLSTATIILPLLVFGMQHTIVKFFSSYSNQEEKDNFLISSLVLPLFIIIPTAIIGVFTYEFLSNWLSVKNALIKNYVYLIFLSAIFMGYFEVFYAWTKVHFKSVFGNVIKELFARVCASILLVGLYFEILSNEQFIIAIIAVYGLRMLIMMVYAFVIYAPKFKFQFPKNYREVISFSMYIIVAGSAGGILLEIDKFMIPQMEEIAEAAYYAVGIYIASVVGIPNRAMQQITTPLTAQDMNENNIDDVGKLYKQSSINLLVVGGLFFLLINLNISELYEIINKPQYTQGIVIVFIISISKLIDLGFGTGNAILMNSIYYKIYFYLSIAMALCVIILNRILIENFGIDGAALATLIVVLTFSLIKIIYIKNKLRIFPFTVETIKLLVLILGIYIGFEFWWKFDWNPIISIVVKGLLLSFIYVIAIKGLKISKDVNALIKKHLLK